jgi:TPR repeat protein
MMAADPMLTRDEQALLAELAAAEAEAAAELAAEREAGEETPAPDPAGTAADERAAAEQAADEGAEQCAADVENRPAAAYLTSSWQDLLACGDAAGLLARAAACGRGEGRERDLAESLACYRAAAELGSPEALYAVALFHLAGAVVPEDLSAGMGQLRSAASAGSLRARVYLANLYELGVGREPDREKADVWYRGVARAAGITDPEDDQAYAMAMAELGSIRHARLLLRDESISQKDRYRYLAKAKMLGYGLHQRHQQRAAVEQAASEQESEEAARPSPAPASAEQAGSGTASPDSRAAPAERRRPAEARAAPRSRARETLRKKRPPLGERMTAFLVALMCVAVGAAGGLLATAAARARVAAGATVPIVGGHVGVILPVTVLCAMLPALIAYPAGMLLCAAAVGGLAFGAGWALWPMPYAHLLADRLEQAQALGLAGLGLMLLVVALFGGTRQRRFE